MYGCPEKWMKMRTNSHSTPLQCHAPQLCLLQISTQRQTGTSLLHSCRSTGFTTPVIAHIACSLHVELRSVALIKISIGDATSVLLCVTIVRNIHSCSVCTICAMFTDNNMYRVLGDVSHASLYLTLYRYHKY